MCAAENIYMCKDSLSQLFDTPFSLILSPLAYQGAVLVRNPLVFKIPLLMHCAMDGSPLMAERSLHDPRLCRTCLEQLRKLIYCWRKSNLDNRGR